MSMDSENPEEEDEDILSQGSLPTLSTAAAQAAEDSPLTCAPPPTWRLKPQQSALLRVPHPPYPRFHTFAILRAAYTAAGSCPEEQSSGHEDPNS